MLLCQRALIQIFYYLGKSNDKKNSKDERTSILQKKIGVAKAEIAF